MILWPKEAMELGHLGEISQIDDFEVGAARCARLQACIKKVPKFYSKS